MGWIIRLVVILDMAARTRVGRVVVIPVVAAGALVGDNRVTSVQRIIIVVVGKRGRAPSGICRMAGCTIHGKSQSLVIGIDRLVKFRCMTRLAFGWCALEAIGVTTETIHRSVCPR